MLEGLEISEVGFSEVAKNKDERTDSDFWTKILKKNPRLNYARIGDCLITSQYGISIEMNEDKHGYPIYRMNEIHNMLCDFDVDKHADISSSEMQIFKLNDRDVLFNRTNSYEWVGRTGIYRKIDERDFVFASYLVRFVPNQTKLLPEYLAAFLNTKYGVSDIKRRSRQSINQTNVNPEEVKEIDIPLLGLDFQSKLKTNFDKAYECLKISETLYTQAEQTLLKAVGLAYFKPSMQNTNIKAFAQSFGISGRLDAEYYQPKYEEIIIKLKSHENGFFKLSEVANTLRGLLVSDSYYQDSGKVAYIRGADISSNKLEKDSMVYIDGYTDGNDKNRCEKGDIIFSLIGSVGTAAILPSEYIGSIVSNNLGIIRVKDNKFQPLVLHLYLTNSKIGGLLFEQQEMRTAQPKISDKNIHEFPIPKIDITTQTNISQLVQQSFSLKAQSEHLLSVAKHAVEMAIEQDEAAAMAWIESSEIA